MGREAVLTHPLTPHESPQLPSFRLDSADASGRSSQLVRATLNCGPQLPTCRYFAHKAN
jgi:hypothetical protein